MEASGFKIICKKCKSEDVDVSAEIGYESPDTPYTIIVFHCNNCGQHK